MIALSDLALTNTEMNIDMMKPFQEINRLLSQLLEIVNVLITLPFAVLVYVATFNRLYDALPFNEDTIHLITIGLTLIWVALFNGFIALLIEKKRLLERLSQSVDAHENEDAAALMPEVQIFTAEAEQKPQPVKSDKAKTTKASMAKKAVTKKPTGRSAPKAAAKKQR